MGLLWNASLVLGTAILIGILQNRAIPRPPTIDVEGWVAPGWEKVEQAFKQNLQSGLELGGAFAVFHKGKKVVDLWGGYRDYESSTPWREDTLALWFSSTKGVCALAAAMLVDRGHLDYDKTVASYWSNFAKNGKEKITVRQLLSHQAGLEFFETKFTTPEQFLDNDYVERILAEQKPLWEPGTEHGYHAFTISMYIDQLVRHVDPKKRSVVEFINEEMKKPLDLDFFLGLPREQNHRAVRIHFVPASAPETFKIIMSHDWTYTLKMFFPTFGNGLLSKMMKSFTYFENLLNYNNPELRILPQGSVMGFSTARSMAKLYGAVANGGKYKGGQLLSSKTIKKLQEPIASGTDYILSNNITFGHGMTLFQNPKGGFIIGTPGLGGQMAYADPQYNLGFAYATNYLQMFSRADDERYLALMNAMYECAEKAN